MANPTQMVDIFESVVQEFNQLGKTDMLKGSISSIKELQGALNAQNEMIKNMLTAGDERGAQRVMRAAMKTQEAQRESIENLRKAKEALAKATQEQNKAAEDAAFKDLQKISSELTKLATQSKQLQKNAGEFSSSMEYAMTKYDRILQTREENIKEMGKAGALIQEKFGDRFEGAVGAFTDGVGDLDNFGKTFTSGLQTLGKFLQARQGKAADLANQGKGGLGMARMLGTMSKVAMATAAIAGSIMVLIKLFNFLEGQVKELNKNILQGHTGIELMHMSGKGMAESLEIARRELGGMKGGQLANDMGIARDEVMGLVNNLADMNMNLGYFGGNFDSLKSSMKQLKGFGEGLGIGFEGAAEYMEKFAVEMGVAAGDASIIAKMESEFAAIRDMALQSSYSTKNFFNQVKELTDSLQSMNNRSAEAGNLFLRFAKIVGPKGVGQMLQGLAAGFRGDSWLDLIKRQMLTKGKDIGDALEVEANRTAKAFINTYMAQLTTLDPQSEASKMLVAQGLLKVNAEGKVESAGLTPEQMVAKLRDMKPADRQRLLGALSMVKEGEGAGRALGDLIDASRGTGKGASRTDRSRAMKRAGGASAVALKFASVANAMRKRNIKDASDISLEAAKEMGLSNQEELDQFGELQDRLKGQLAIAQSMVKDGNITDQERAQIEAMGLRVVENAKTGKMELMMADQNKKVDSVVDMIMAQGAAIEDEYGGVEEHQMTTEDYLAQQVTETQAISERINNHIGGILQTMSDYLFGILNWTREDKEARGTRQKVYDTIRAEAEKERENQRTAGRNLGAFDRQTKVERRQLMQSDEYKKASRKRKRAMLEEYDNKRKTGRGKIEAQQKQSKDRLKLLAEARRNLSAEKLEIDYTGWGQLTAEETLEEAQKLAARSMARRGDTSLLDQASIDRINREEAAKKAAKEALKGTGFKSHEELIKAVKSGNLTDKQRQALRDKGFLILKNNEAIVEPENARTRKSTQSFQSTVEKVRQSSEFQNLASRPDLTEKQKYEARRKLLRKAIRKEARANRDTVYQDSHQSGYQIMGPDGKPILGKIGRGVHGLRTAGVNNEAVRTMARSGLKLDRNLKATESAMPQFTASNAMRQAEAPKAVPAVEQAVLAKSLEDLAQHVKPLTDAELRKRAQDDAKAAKDINSDMTTSGVLKALEKHEEAQRKKKLEAVAKALGLSREGGIDAIAKRVSAASRKGLSDDQRARLSTLQVGGNNLASNLLSGGGVPAGATPVNPKDTLKDFWIDSQGNVWKIDRNDLPSPMGGGNMAMTKPGGPVQNYVTEAISAILSNGAGMTLTVNIDGSKNPEETGRAVVRKVKEMQQQVMGGPR